LIGLDQLVQLGGEHGLDEERAIREHKPARNEKGISFAK
jgi:hypothetical protein